MYKNIPFSVIITGPDISAYYHNPDSQLGFPVWPDISLNSE
jgi:hypothetical protein